MTQLVLGRYSRRFGGVDWGAKRRVICAIRPGRNAGKDAEPSAMIFINEGHSAAHGARGFGRDYHKARLVMIHHNDGRRDSRDLGEGRITKAMLTDNAAKIDALFGAGVTAQLDLKETFWIEPEDLT